MCMYVCGVDSLEKLTWHTFSPNYVKPKWMGLDFRVFPNTHTRTHTAHTHTQHAHTQNRLNRHFIFEITNCMPHSACNRSGSGNGSSCTATAKIDDFSGEKWLINSALLAYHRCAPHAAHNTVCIQEEYKAEVIFGDVVPPSGCGCVFVGVFVGLCLSTTCKKKFSK